MKRMRYFLEAAVVYAVYGFFKIFPLTVASNMGGFIMRHAGPRLGLSKKARQNLRHAFPEKNADEIEKIVAGMWDNLGRVVAEYPHLDDIWHVTEVANAHLIDEMKNDGRGGIVVGGHLANWEVPPVIVKRENLDFAIVYRKPNNPGVETLLRKARGGANVDQIPKGGAGARVMFSMLKKGKHIGVLVDQKLNEGIAVPFFGQPAMTAPAVASLALKMNIPLYPMRIERLSGAHFKITFFSALDLRELNDSYAIMSRINNLLEEWIRDKPEQWLWIHRRWGRWPDEAQDIDVM